MTTTNLILTTTSAQPDEHWRWLGFAVRCALEPDEPRLIQRYFDAGDRLVMLGERSGWQVAEMGYNLLLISAGDTLLPWHWRCICLDHANRPLCWLRQLAGTTRALRARVDRQANRLASLYLHPSIPRSELVEGNSDE